MKKRGKAIGLPRQEVFVRSGNGTVIDPIDREAAAVAKKKAAEAKRLAAEKKKAAAARKVAAAAPGSSSPTGSASE